MKKGEAFRYFCLVFSKSFWPNQKVIQDYVVLIETWNWIGVIKLIYHQNAVACFVVCQIPCHGKNCPKRGEFLKKTCHTFYWQTRVSSNRFINQPLPLCLVLVICRYLAQLMVCLPQQLYNLWWMSKISQQRFGPYRQLICVSGFWLGSPDPAIRNNAPIFAFFNWLPLHFNAPQTTYLWFETHALIKSNFHFYGFLCGKMSKYTSSHKRLH